MDDAPFRIMLLRDADKCAINEALKEDRNKTTISELKMEYENWLNSLGGLQIEFPAVVSGSAPLIGSQNSITALVDRDRMWFFPFTYI